MKKFFYLLMFAISSTLTIPSYSANREICDNNNPINVDNTNDNIDNGHRFVDLALPSGTKWADCNIGASSPTEYGNYYAWGEKTKKSDYVGSTYKYGNAHNKLTKYCTRPSYGLNGFTDNKTELILFDDVARQSWGGSWRIPSKEQFDELIDYTKHMWTSINGVKGILFTGRNGNSIFLPAAGYRSDTSLYDAGCIGNYWSRTINEGYPGHAYYLHFSSNNAYVNYLLLRFDGRPIRPVRP